MTEESIELEDRVLGAVFGHLVGDAFGVPYEFQCSEDLPDVLDWRGWGTHNQPPGTWSDDGALMLCLLASLHEKGRLDPVDVGHRFIAWLDDGYMAAGGIVFDVGGTTRDAIANLQSGVQALDAGPKTERDNGNGSLMRVLPLALWAHHLPVGEFIPIMQACSRITHGHSCSQVCCAIYGLLIRHLLSNDEIGSAWDTAIGAARNYYQGAGISDCLNELDRVQKHETCSGSGFVVDCLRSAWQAVIEARDFSSAIRAAVRFGNDTDTTAAVAGGLAGAIWGINAIPESWREGLRLDHGQRSLINAFANMRSTKSQVGHRR